MWGKVMCCFMSSCLSLALHFFLFSLLTLCLLFAAPSAPQTAAVHDGHVSHLAMKDLCLSPIRLMFPNRIAQSNNHQPAGSFYTF